MANLTLTAMVAPAGAEGRTTILHDGSPIRPRDTGVGASPSLTKHIVHVRSRDVATLQAAGYTVATAADLRAGSPTSLDVGWAESN